LLSVGVKVSEEGGGRRELVERGRKENVAFLLEGARGSMVLISDRVQMILTSISRALGSCSSDVVGKLKLFSFAWFR
jgi:hypothetical protein